METEYRLHDLLSTDRDFYSEKERKKKSESESKKSLQSIGLDDDDDDDFSYKSTDTFILFGISFLNSNWFSVKK